MLRFCNYLKKSKSIDFDDIDSDKHLVNKLMQLKKNNQVSLEYLVNDKAISKKELFIEKNITDEQIKDIIPKLRKNSTNQLRLLKVLLDEKKFKY